MISQLLICKGCVSSCPNVKCVCFFFRVSLTVRKALVVVFSGSNISLMIRFGFCEKGTSLKVLLWGSDTSHETTNTNHFPLGRKLRNEFHATTSSYLSVLAQLGQRAAGWMDGVWAVGDWGSEEGSRVTFLPLGLCVCQQGHSQFSPKKTGREEFLLCAPCWMELQPHGGLCVVGTCVCVYAQRFKPSTQFHARCTHFIFLHSNKLYLQLKNVETSLLLCSGCYI